MIIVIIFDIIIIAALLDFIYNISENILLFNFFFNLICCKF